MIRFLWAVVFSLIFVQSSFATGDSAEALYAKAYANLYKGNTRNASAIFTRAINAYPDCAFLYAGLGDVYKKEGNLDKAQEYYTLAQQKKYPTEGYKIDFYSISVQKSMENINSALNSLFSASKNTDNAFIYSNINLIMNEKYSSLKLIPDMYINTSDEALNKANTMKASGKKEDGLKEYLKILSSSPKNFQAANNAGVTLIELKDYNLAKKYLEEALELNSNSSIIYNNIAINNFYQKNYTEMANNFSQALKINSDYLPGINNLAVSKILADITSYTSANTESLLEILKNNFENCYAARTLAKIYFLKGDFKSADNILKPFNSTYNFKLYTQKAYMAFLAGDNSNALTYINKAITLYSDNAIDYEIRARIYDKAGMYQEAKDDFSKAISKNSKRAETYYYYARSLYNSGDIQSANTTMKTFITLKKGNPQTSFLKLLFE